MSFKYYDPDLYKTSQDTGESELDGYTEDFLTLIGQYAPKGGFGGISMTIGMLGGGKSCLMCILDHKFLISAYEQRNIALYKAPDKLLKEILKEVPKPFKEKFRIVDRLSEIQPFDVLNLDEGYLSADAKDFLTKNARNFIKSIVAARQQSVFAILNTQDDGILRGYRTKAQIKFYKLLTDGYIEENPKDKFAQKYGSILTNLFAPQYTLFRNTHPWLLRRGLRTGYLYMDYHDHCPWWSDNISRYFEGENFDAVLRETREIKEKAEPVIQLLAGVFGPKITLSDARGYLWDHHEDLLLTFEDQLKYIVSAVKTRFKLANLSQEKYKTKFKSSELLKDTKTPENYSKITLPTFTRKTSFPEFLLQYYRINLEYNEPEEREYQALIMYDWANGLSQADIRDQRGGSPNRINEIIKKYRSGYKLSNDQLRVAYAFEYYIAKITNAIRCGGIGEPDLMYYENAKPFGPGEVKVVQPKGNTIQFYLFSKNSHYHTLNPSYYYCLKHNLPKFPLFYFWPKWGIIPMAIDIQMPDPKTNIFNYTIAVEKPKYDEYSANFTYFNKFNFFYSS